MIYHHYTNKSNNPGAKHNRHRYERSNKVKNVIVPATCHIHLSSIPCWTTATLPFQSKENERERHSEQELFKSTSIISNKLCRSWFEGCSLCIRLTTSGKRKIILKNTCHAFFFFFPLLFENHKLLMFIPISLLGIKLYKTVIGERRGKN